jgi:hypothetical protein
MDAGRGEQQAIVQARLTLMHTILTRAWIQHKTTQVGTTGARTAKPRI